MKIVLVEDRYFLVEDMSQVHDLALKVLNEWRALGSLKGKALEFAEAACDAIDGDLAWGLLCRLSEVKVITPEYVR